MNEILRGILCLLALFLIAKILTAILPIKVRLFKKVIGKTESKFASFENSGELKKAHTMKVLRWLLIKTDDFTSLMIDAIVSVANEQGCEMQTSLKSMTTAEIIARMAALQAMLTGSGSGKDNK